MLRSYLQLLNAGGTLMVVDSNQLRFSDSAGSSSSGQGLAPGQGQGSITSVPTTGTSGSGSNSPIPSRLSTFPIDDRFLFLHELLDVRIRGKGDGPVAHSCCTQHSP